MLRVLLIVWMIWGWLAGQAVANGTRHAGAAEIETVLHGAGAFPSPASLLRAARPPFPLLHAANPTNDGVRSFVFDPENRLTSVFVPGAWRSDFGYDGLGRRRTATDFTWQGGWAETNQTRYLYDGLQIIQERDSNNVPRITYTRGLDFSGTLAGAGGIGGLLGRSQAATNGWQHYYYHADGSGNVTALFDGQATMQARYLYGPFGRLVAQWGPLAGVNAMQFSSMPAHAASGLSLYPFRAYDPGFQRWLTRDPIAEAGGVNLYGFVGNTPPGRADPLGLAWYDYIPGIGPGIAQINANAALQAMLTKNGYDSLGDFQLAHPGVCGSIVSGNPDAVAGAANIASGATDIYLNTAQVIATGGIASPGAGGPAAAKGIKGPGGKGPCKPAAPGTEPGLPSLAEAAGAAAAGAGTGLRLAGGAQSMVAGTQDGVLLGTVENSQINLFQAAAGQIEGHADLLSAGLASPGAQGFSIAVQNGPVTAIFQNSILNPASANYLLPAQTTQQVLQALGATSAKLFP